MTTTVPSVDGEQDPFARTASTRRVGLALAMLIAPWFIVAAETVHAILSPGGADDLDPAVALAKTADHPTLTAWGGLAGMLGALLLVPAVLGVMRLVRTGAARLGLVGGVLTAAGYVAYFALLFHGVGTEQAMVSVGGSMHQNVEILDKFMMQPWTVWVGPLFVLGNIVGTFLLGLALVRSRAAVSVRTPPDSLALSSPVSPTCPRTPRCSRPRPSSAGHLSARLHSSRRHPSRTGLARDA
jgi:hypothetical protein